MKNSNISVYLYFQFITVFHISLVCYCASMGDWQSGARELLHTERGIGAISVEAFSLFGWRWIWDWLKIYVLKFFAEFDEIKSVRDSTKIKKGNLRESNCGSTKKREKRFSCLGLERLSTQIFRSVFLTESGVRLFCTLVEFGTGYLKYSNAL